MTLDRSREIAKKTSDQISGEWPLMMNDLEHIIESALLAFAKEVLTQEPDAEMHRAGLREEDKVWPTYDYTEGCALKVWHAMSAHRAKSLEDGE